MLCRQAIRAAAHVHAVAATLLSGLLCLPLQNAAGVDEEDEQGLTPLHTAAELGSTEIAEHLLERGADLNHAGEPRCITALHVASYHNQGDMVQLLLDKGIKVNVQDANGHTPLHIAALLNHHHLIGPLLAAGVDVSLKDKSGKTAQQLALDKGSDDVMRQLDAFKL
jgi:ankyrin repeat protein